MNQALLVYRFATAFQGAIKIMLKRSCAAVLAACAAGLLICAGAARGDTTAQGKSTPASNLGLYPASEFRPAKVADAACEGCTTSRQALWYFSNDWVAVPANGVPAAGFTPGLAPQADVRQWYVAAKPEDLLVRPPLLWLGATQSVRDVMLADDNTLRYQDGRHVPFQLVDKINTNLSYYDAASKAYLQQRPLRMRGEQRGEAFVARTIWPQDWAIQEAGMTMQPLLPGESLLGLVRKYPSARDERFETRLLWEKEKAKSSATARNGARDWSGHAAIGIILNGAQGDDDEAHGGHFAIATGRLGKGNDMADWIVNNFYNLGSHSEKGITAAMLPLDNYMADVNSGQAWYRPSYMLVAVLKKDRAAHAYQGAIARVYHHLYRQDFKYRHASNNCAGISIDTLRTLGWEIPLQGPTSRTKAIIGYPFKAVTELSFASGKEAYDYMSEERSRLYPAAAYDAAGRDLMRIAAGGAGKAGADAKALDTFLREDLEALVFVRLPQIPSSRPFGSYPVASIDEYMKRAPEDKALWKIVPVEPRPFPLALLAADTKPEFEMPAWAPAAIVLLFVFGVIWRSRAKRQRREPEWRHR